MKNKESLRQKTKNIAISAVLSAMGVVLLYFGSIIQVLDLSMAALASMLVIFAVIEIGGVYPYGIYIVTGVLSVILLPVKLPAVYFVLFAGFYPIIKEKFERFNRILEWIAKIASFNIALTAIMLVSKYILLIPNEIDLFIVVIYFFGNGVFVLYDIALTRLIRFYIVKLRKRFKIK